MVKAEIRHFFFPKRFILILPTLLRDSLKRALKSIKLNFIEA